MFQRPNYTQTPNDFFDEIAKTLKEGELRVLLVVMRQTFGWQKRWDRISLSQLEQKTGMCRDSVNNALKSLIEKKLIIKHKEGAIGRQKCWYTLCVENEEQEPEIDTEFIEESNISYQSSKTTPPSRLKRPTKETITKEKEKREEATPPPPPSFYVHKRVMMVSEKFDKLVEEFGIDKIKEMMERLDEYADINPKRFKQYACHAAVIRKWIREDTSKGKKVDLKASKAASEAWSEGENRSWWNDMASLLKPYEKEGLIYSGSSYVEFSRPGKYPIKIYFNYPDFVKVAKDCLKDLEIMV